VRRSGKGLTGELNKQILAAGALQRIRSEMVAGNPAFSRTHTGRTDRGCSLSLWHWPCSARDGVTFFV
jgi:hypothetical protein